MSWIKIIVWKLDLYSITGISAKVALFETDELQSSGSMDRPYKDSDSCDIPFSKNSQNRGFLDFPESTIPTFEHLKAKSTAQNCIIAYKSEISAILHLRCYTIINIFNDVERT